MKFLVTGGIGFIGSSFCREVLSDDNNQVLVIDKMTYAANPLTLEKLTTCSNFSFINMDICDKAIINIFKQFSPNVVINFAAETHVDRSIEGSAEFVNTNILGVYNLLEASREYLQSGNKDKTYFRFIQISTDEVYGSLLSSDDIAFSENSVYNPSSPYSATKAAADHLINAWYKTYNIPTIVTHCSNNFGAYQFPEKLIPNVIIKALSNQPIDIYGDGKNIRDWIYVEDHVKALLDLVKNGEVGEVYNIGANSEYSNIEVVEKICSILDNIEETKRGISYKNLIRFVADRPAHDFRYAIDNSKIKEHIDWSPVTDFDEALFNTIKWYLDNRGYFFESYNKKLFAENGIDIDFVQSNQSFSKYGTIRGLHFQKAEAAQAKLVRAASGRILDIAVDIRVNSPSFGKYFAVELNADNNLQLFIPSGFAHGFSVLSDTATIIYECDKFYSPEHEAGILFNDKELDIDWQIDISKALISDKDLNNTMSFEAYKRNPCFF